MMDVDSGAQDPATTARAAAIVLNVEGGEAMSEHRRKIAERSLQRQ